MVILVDILYVSLCHIMVVLLQISHLGTFDNLQHAKQLTVFYSHRIAVDKIFNVFIFTHKIHSVRQDAPITNMRKGLCAYSSSY